jgi:hypothetical protein
VADVIEWLLQGEPWVQYRVRVDLLDQPESVWQAWQDWEFGQKREPSRWVTFLVLRINKRLGLAVE